MSGKRLFSALSKPKIDNEILKKIREHKENKKGRIQKIFQHENENGLKKAFLPPKNIIIAMMLNT